jgi:hypothetical protein
MPLDGVRIGAGRVGWLLDRIVLSSMCDLVGDCWVLLELVGGCSTFAKVYSVIWLDIVRTG